MRKTLKRMKAATPKAKPKLQSTLSAMKKATKPSPLAGRLSAIKAVAKPKPKVRRKPRIRKATTRTTRRRRAY